MDQNSNNIETALKKYRPADLPPELREEIFQSGNKSLKRLRNLKRLGLAATVLIAASIGICIFQINRQPREIVEMNGAKESTEFQVSLERAGYVAQLLAIADMYAEQAGAEEFARERYSYIARTFPQMEVGALAQNKLKQFTERMFSNE